MANEHSYQIIDNANSKQPFIVINLQNIIKLTPHSYLSWKLQVEAMLVGHDLKKFIDNTYPCPSSTHTVDEKEVSNPKFTYWIRQDQLLFGALIGTLNPDLVPLVVGTKSSKALWE